MTEKNDVPTMSEGEGDDSLMPTRAMELKAPKTQTKMQHQAAASLSLGRMMREIPKEKEVTAEVVTKPVVQRRNSQIGFASPEQTCIIFDWDDTLFPTTYVRHEKGIHWRYPLDEQTKTFTPAQIQTLKRHLASLQEYVLKVLTQSLSLGHVVIVTLARPPWVTLSCDNFFPQVGAFLKEHDIKIIYAQDVSGSAAKDYDKQKFRSDEELELFWIQTKQRAIQSEIAKFYAKSESSWKNIISLGDSDFERFATQASLRDYATLDEDNISLEPEVGSASSKLAVLKPSTSKSKKPDNHAVSGFVGTHYRRLRCKTVKMFDSPGIEDLATEMSMLHKWMPFLVEKDGGFDVDLEDDANLYEMHFKLTGEKLDK